MATYNLPTEITSMIIGYLPAPLAPYASVCRQWQSIVEEKNFSTLYCKSGQLLEFKKVLSSPHRRSLVRQLNFHVILPSYEGATRACIESDEDRNLNNRIFTNSIQALFDILATWEDQISISLSLSFYSPGDDRHSEDRRERVRTGRRYPRKDLLSWRYEWSYLQLSELDGKAIPSVNVVVDLKVKGKGKSRKIAPAAVSAIIARLPRVQSAVISLFDNQKDFPSLRNTLRDGFAKTLHLWPTSIKTLHLNYPGHAPLNERIPPTARSKKGEDALSLALNRFTQGLETIHIKNIMIGPEFFWPPNKFNPQSAIWKHLTRLELHYAACTPAGDWLFERKGQDEFEEGEEEFDEDDDDDNDGAYSDSWEEPHAPRNPARQDYPEVLFRSMPTPKLNEVYLAAGRAAQHMPALQMMKLMSSVWTSSTGPACHWFRYCRTTQKATWVGTSRFRMNDELKEAWSEAARRHGLDNFKVENVGFRETVDPDWYDEMTEDEKPDNNYRVWDD